VEQTGTPTGIFRQPHSAWVASFFGMGSLLDARIKRTEQGVQAHTRVGVFQLASDLTESFSDDENAVLLLRPEDARIGSGENGFPVRVTDQRFIGDRFINWAETETGFRLQLTRTEPTPIGTQFLVHYPPECLLPLHNAEAAGG
jgi:ABC-type Fe3+/spermidine/putrescine transport system ATPase subunit